MILLATLCVVSLCVCVCMCVISNRNTRKKPYHVLDPREREPCCIKYTASPCRTNVPRPDMSRSKRAEGGGRGGMVDKIFKKVESS